MLYIGSVLGGSWMLLGRCFGCYQLGISGNHDVGCCWVIGWLN